jgi:hypothetical protein
MVVPIADDDTVTMTTGTHPMSISDPNRDVASPSLIPSKTWAKASDWEALSVPLPVPVTALDLDPDIANPTTAATIATDMVIDMTDTIVGVVATATVQVLGVEAGAEAVTSPRRNGNKPPKQPLLPEPSRLSAAARNPVLGQEKKVNGSLPPLWALLASTVLSTKILIARASGTLLNPPLVVF